MELVGCVGECVGEGRPAGIKVNRGRRGLRGRQERGRGRQGEREEMRRGGGRGEPSKHFPVHFSSSGLNWAPLLFSLPYSRHVSSTGARPHSAFFPPPNPQNRSCPSRRRFPSAGFAGSAPSRRALPRHLYCCFTQLRRGPPGNLA